MINQIFDIEPPEIFWFKLLSVIHECDPKCPHIEIYCYT